MNSLLQTLYMTPEFRSALYQWKFDAAKEPEPKETAGAKASEVRRCGSMHCKGLTGLKGQEEA